MTAAVRRRLAGSHRTAVEEAAERIQAVAAPRKARRREALAGSLA